MSNDVIEAVSHALQVDDAEHAHLLDLVRIANLDRPPRPASGSQQVRPSIREWHRLVPELEKRGHEAIAVRLPAEDDGAGWPEYADAVVKAVGDRDELQYS